jgi:hypothetical protein
MIYSLALVLLLGFELSYYLLVVQTGIVAHYHSDLVTLFPMFAGGVLGTFLGGKSWGKINNPIHKIMIALSLQLLLSFTYPNYNTATLGLLGIAVGLMAPLGIYLFKAKQKKELLFALAIAYTVGTYFYTTMVDDRLWMAVFFSVVTLGSASILKDYKVQTDTKVISHSFGSYFPLILWILLDSNLFETLSRHENLNIWSNHTAVIIIFHLIGLIAAYFIHTPKMKQRVFIALLFMGSYALSYFEWTFALAMLYPFTISYYNVVVFTALSQEMSLSRLAYLMIFIGWIASGLGLAIALSKVFH